MKEFDIDKHLDSQTNDYLNSMEMSREEIERLEIEIDNKLMALADELNDMLSDINKEYKYHKHNK